MVYIPPSRLSVIDKYPRFFPPASFSPFFPCFHGCIRWRFVLLAVQVELSYHAEGQTNSTATCGLHMNVTL